MAKGQLDSPFDVPLQPSGTHNRRANFPGNIPGEVSIPGVGQLGATVNIGMPGKSALGENSGLLSDNLFIEPSNTDGGRSAGGGVTLDSQFVAPLTPKG